MRYLNNEEKEIAFKVLDSVLKMLEKEKQNWTECEKRFQVKGGLREAAIARATADGVGFSISCVECKRMLIDELGGVE